MKKLLALCLTVMLVVAMVPAFAVSADAAPAITVSNAEGFAGDTVTVKVALADNPGIISFKFAIAYDAAVLELTDKAPGTFSPLNYSQTIDANPYIVNWVDSVNPDRTDSDVVTLTFKIKDDAAIGETKIAVTYDQEDVFNAAWEDVVFAAGEGVVTVKCAHAETTVEGAVEATCDTAGSTGTEKCTKCGEVITEATEIAALGHDTEVVGAKDHTADEDGYTGDVVCKVCEKVITAGEVIPKGHVVEKVEGKEATCTEDGYKEHYACTLCDAIFADEAATEVIDDVKIEATGHKFVDGKCECGAEEEKEEKPATDTQKPADKPNTDKGDKAPATNDMANIFVVVAMLVAAAAASIVVLKKKA